MSIVIQSNRDQMFRVYNTETKKALRFKPFLGYIWLPTNPEKRVFPYTSRDEAIAEYNNWKKENEISKLDHNSIVYEEVID